MRFLNRNGFGAGSVALATLVAGSALAQAAVTAPPPAPVVAQLGTVSISAAEVQQLLRAMPESERAQVRSQRQGLESWLRQRLAGEALLREAQQKNWAQRADVKARIDAAVKDVTARIVTSSYLESVAQAPADFPGEADVAAAYERAKPQLAANYRVAQIFLPVATDADAATLESVRGLAAALALQARAGDFAALARAHSQDRASAVQGGEVGNLPLAQLLPETRDIVAAMQPGQVSDPVRSSAGFHVLKLLDHQPERPATLAQARPALRAALREQRQQELVNAYLARLAPAASVRIDDAALDAVLQNVN